MRQKKTLTEIYLEAAERVHDGKCEYSCVAVKGATRKWNYCAAQIAEVKRYVAAFAPDGDYENFAMHVDISLLKGGLPDGEKLKNLRVLMLCLMAVAWKDLK